MLFHKLWNEHCIPYTDKGSSQGRNLPFGNEVVEKANADLEGSRNEFQTNASLKSDAETSVRSTTGKLEVFKRHYGHLVTRSMDSYFYTDWKERTY